MELDTNPIPLSSLKCATTALMFSTAISINWSHQECPCLPMIYSKCFMSREEGKNKPKYIRGNHSNTLTFL